METLETPINLIYNLSAMKGYYNSGRRSFRYERPRRGGRMKRRFSSTRSNFRDRRFDNFKRGRNFRKTKPLTQESLDNDLENYYKRQNGTDNCKNHIL